MLVPVPLPLELTIGGVEMETFLKHQALSLCFPRSLRQSTTRRAAQPSAQVNSYSRLDWQARTHDCVHGTGQKTVNAHLSDFGYVIALCNHVE